MYDCLRKFIEKTKKLFEGDHGVDLAFQFRIGVDVKPLLEQEEFHENQGHICLVAHEEGDAALPR